MKNILRNYFYKISILTLFFIIGEAHGQTDPCGNELLFQTTVEQYQKDLTKSIEAFEDWKKLRSVDSENEIIIPVHFIVHHFPGEKYGTKNNLTDQHILSQIDILNEFFAKENADTTLVPQQF